MLFSGFNTFLTHFELNTLFKVCFLVSSFMCVYSVIVVLKLLWRISSCAILISTWFVTSVVAKVCHYGIITTNGKSLDFQGVSAFVAVYSIPFPKLKYGEKIDEKRRLLH